MILLLRGVVILVLRLLQLLLILLLLIILIRVFIPCILRRLSNHPAVNSDNNRKPEQQY